MLQILLSIDIALALALVIVLGRSTAAELRKFLKDYRPTKHGS